MVGLGLLLGAVSFQATADVNYKNYVVGDEYGVEYQLERVDGDKYVERTLGRRLKTFDWSLYRDDKGNTLDSEAKIGAILGYYKGSDVGSGNEFGSLTSGLAGITGEASSSYTFNLNKVDPFIGLSTDMELRSMNYRLEWQADVLTGVKFNVSENKDISIKYQKTLAHGMSYFADNGQRYRQDDGYAVALIGTKRTNTGGSHSLKLQYQHFDIGPDILLKDGSSSYEPDTVNWLISYKRTL